MKKGQENSVSSCHHIKTGQKERKGKEEKRISRKDKRKGRREEEEDKDLLYMDTPT